MENSSGSRKPNQKLNWARIARNLGRILYPPYNDERRKAIKQMGVVSTALILTACAPSSTIIVVDDEEKENPVKNDPVENDPLKEIEDLSEYYAVAKEFGADYGDEVLKQVVSSWAVLNDPYLACVNAFEHNQFSPTFKSSVWGREVKNGENIDQKAQDHLDEILPQHLNLGYQIDWENLKYTPIDLTTNTTYKLPDRKFVESAIRQFDNVFPPLSFVVDDYYIHSGSSGGLHTGSGDIVIPDPTNNLESFFTVTFHEKVHALHSNYLALLPYLSLKQFAEIPTQLLKNINIIAKDWLSKPFDAQVLKDYGLYLEVHKSYGSKTSAHEATNDLLSRCLSILNLSSEIPQDMLIQASDDDATRKIKEDQQLNFVIHTVGNSLLAKNNRFNDLEKKSVTAELMKLFFSEAVHFLVDPYRTSGNGIIDDYNIIPSGIYVHKLAHHKSMMQVLVNPALSQEPNVIRETLGLASFINPNIGEKYFGETSVYGIKYTVYSLPSYGGLDYFYIKSDGSNNPGYWIRLIPDYIRGPRDIVDLVRTPYSENTAVNFLTCPPILANNPRVFRTDKIRYRGIDDVSINEFILIDEPQPNSGPLTRIYQRPGDFNPSKAVVYDSHDRQGYTGSSLAVFSNGNTYMSQENYLPIFNALQKSMFVTSVINKDSIQIGYVEGPQKRLTFELGLTEASRNEINSWILGKEDHVLHASCQINIKDTQTKGQTDVEIILQITDPETNTVIEYPATYIQHV